MIDLVKMIEQLNNYIIFGELVDNLFGNEVSLCQQRRVTTWTKADKLSFGPYTHMSEKLEIPTFFFG